MGSSCSKIDGADSFSEDADHHHHNTQQRQQRQQQQPQQYRQYEPTVVDLPPRPPPQAGIKRPNRARRSIFRVGSMVLRNHGRNGGNDAILASPQRASNYNHVHNAVSINFQEADKSNRGTRSTPLGVVGLRNLGNTCFLNSSLQCLSATIPLTDYFLGYNYRSEINKANFLGTQGKLVTAYAELIKGMWLGKSTVIKPVSFKSQLEKFCPAFYGTEQHDAQELLAFLLDGIHEDLNRIQTKPYIEDADCDGTSDERDAIEAWKNYLRRDKSLVVDIFQGQLRNTCQCLKCGHVNIRFEPFMYLSLPMSDSGKSLSDCLDLYLAQEKLVGDNQWYCIKCKRHRNATKKIDLWILPPILIVHLKRFKVNPHGHRGSKRDVAINYPIEKWDLSDAVKSRGSEYPLYDLYAVSNHVGGLHGGHYTANSLNRFDDQWYEYNDSTCTRVDTDRLRRNRSSAYLLFYNRSELDRSNNSSSSDPAKTSRAPLMIRRQSVSRPDLWPHTQIQDRSEFRDFSRVSVRHSIRKAFPMAPLLDDENHATMEEAVDVVFEGDNTVSEEL